MKQTHVFYIDDSGTKEYGANPDSYGKGNSRYFVFGGLLTTIQEAGQLSSDIIALKLHYFNSDSVEIKSNWLRIPREQKKYYLDPYGLSEGNLKAFMDDYYDCLSKAEIMFIAAVVDKQHMQEKYPNPWYPPDVAYEALLQRVQDELQDTGLVSIIIDDMTGATPRGNQYKQNLIRLHGRLIKHGSFLMRKFTFPCLHGSLKFVNSAQSHMIQVADIAAYNVYRQFVDYGSQWEDKNINSLPTYDYFSRIGNKFRKDENGRIQGYGVVKFPLIERVRWGVKRSEKK